MIRREAISRAVEKLFNQEVDFLQRLVQAKSVNPFTPDTSLPTTPVEKEVAAITYQELQQLGFHAELHGVSSERPNVICHVPGSGETKKTLILNTHMDTVEPVDYTRDPWGIQTENKRLYGVGVADAKAQIAAFSYAAKALQLAGIKTAGNLTLAFVVDEETGACSPYGTKYLLEKGSLSGDAAIIGEPGNNTIATGHRGLYRFRLTIRGEATHTGLRAWEQGTQGHNAILDMARIAQALSEYTLPKSSSTAFPDRKSLLTFPTIIRGGSGVNIVPSTCEAYGEARLLPGLTASDIKALIKMQLKKLSIAEYRLDDLIIVPAVEIDPQSEIVQALAGANETITSTHPPLRGAGPTCDGWMFITRGIPAICGYGVTCGGVHGADEWIDLDSLRQTTEIYAHTILNYLEEGTM